MNIIGPKTKDYLLEYYYLCKMEKKIIGQELMTGRYVCIRT